MNQAQNGNSSNLMKPKEVADFLRISESTVKSMEKRGILPMIRINKHGHRRFRVSDVLKLLRTD